VSETETSWTRPTDPVGRVLYPICYGLSIVGGLVVSAMAVIITLSVIGRSTFNTPIYGDFEIITVSTGVAVFLFLPLCQLMRENVVVDFFMANASVRLKSACDAAASLTYGVIVALMSWRTAIGGVGVYQNHEETILLSWPLWSTFPLAVVCLLVLLCVCIYTLFSDLKLTRSGSSGAR